MLRALTMVGIMAISCAPATADEPGDAFLSFIRRQAAALRANDKAPSTLELWKHQTTALRAHLLASWGGFPAQPAPLLPRKLGELLRPGYRVEKLVFQTLPGVLMTANAYVPDRPGKHPAVLCVHGHWPGAKQDPIVQARCIGLVKLGYFVLVVDAFGAGERAIGRALGEYHGEMTAATLLPAGCPLSGIQVYENLRAVDYLCTRPDVDPKRLGITGASGGGNQSMYSGAWDDRFSAVVPVCSVGNYQAYLGAACCMCEVVPGSLRFTEEAGVLGLVAPRGLMVINATRDAHQFSVAEANKTLAALDPVYRLFGSAEALRHVTFESGHDYSKPMREVMYGWMARHLRGEGNGDPIQEPEIHTEDPETLRCFPGASRPDDWITLPRYAAARSREILRTREAPTSDKEWEKQRAKLRSALVDRVFGGFPRSPHAIAAVTHSNSGPSRTITFEPEAGIQLTAGIEQGTDTGAPLTVLLDLDGQDSPAVKRFTAELKSTGHTVVTLDLRATGNLAVKKDAVGAAPDHNSAEWSLWIGRPLLGQWAWDVHCLIDALSHDSQRSISNIQIIGIGPAGVVALCAAATDERISAVATVGTLASYVTDAPYVGQRLGIMAPGVLREVGDVTHIAALIAPRRLVIAGGVDGAGNVLDANQLTHVFEPAANVWKLMGHESSISILTDPDTVVSALKR